MMITTPIFIEKTVRGSNVFWYYAASDYILEKGYLNLSMHQYHSWPGFFIISSSFILLTNSSPYILLLIYDSLIKILTSLLIFQLGKHFDLEKNQNYTFVWLYLSLQMLDRYYFNAPSFALVLYYSGLLLFFVFLRNLKINNKKNIFKIVTLIVFLLISLILSHIMLPFVLILNIVFLGGKKLLRFKKLHKISKKKKAIIFVSLLISLIIILVPLFFYPKINDLLKSILEENKFFTDPLGYLQRFLPNVPKYDSVGPIILYSFFFLIIIVSFILIVVKIRQKDIINKDVMSIIQIISSMCLILFLTYGTTPETFEIRSRIFEITLPFLLLLFLRFKKKASFFTFFLVITCPFAFMFSHYSLEKYTFTPQSELDGYTHLFNLDIDENTVIITSVFSSYYYFDYGEYLLKIPPDFNTNKTYDDFKELIKNIAGNLTTIYIIMNNRSYLWDEDGGFSVGYGSPQAFLIFYNYAVNTNEWDTLFLNSNIHLLRANSNFFSA